MATSSYEYLKDLIKSQKPGYNLNQLFYNDPDIFQLDLNTFFFNHWIFFLKQEMNLLF